MSVANGKAKYNAKVPSMSENYNAAKGSMPDDYAQGLADAGVTVGPRTRSAYQAGISRASFSVPAGAADKWERNYLRAMAR